MIIDFHTHTFPDKIAAKAVKGLAKKSRTLPFLDGSVDALSKSAKAAGIDYCINLPVMTSPEQVEKLNASLIAGADGLKQKGIITFGGMHPDYAGDIKSQLSSLKSAGIKGIKIHPAYQNIVFDDIRFLRIIDQAEELGLLVITHAGIDIGIYDRNYVSVTHVLNVLKEVKPSGLILAHMGGWGTWDEVESDLAGAPVYFDTAFSLGPITPLPDCKEPHYLSENMKKEDFTRLAKKHGTEKILFATDSPWAVQREYIDFVKSCPFTEEEQNDIFSNNAVRLLSL